RRDAVVSTPHTLIRFLKANAFFAELGPEAIETTAPAVQALLIAPRNAHKLRLDGRRDAVVSTPHTLIRFLKANAFFAELGPEAIET
ncbi:hypothetical protein CTI14_65875, partial [Methylobacterium radiotolerans]